jgi:hypothetical protein
MFKHYILKRKGVKQLRNSVLKRLAILLLCIGIHGGLAIFPWPTASHLSTTSVSAGECRPLTLALVPLVNSPSDIEWRFSLEVVDSLITARSALIADPCPSDNLVVLQNGRLEKPVELSASGQPDNCADKPRAELRQIFDSVDRGKHGVEDLDIYELLKRTASELRTGVKTESSQVVVLIMATGGDFDSEERLVQYLKRYEIPDEIPDDIGRVATLLVGQHPETDSTDLRVSYSGTTGQSIVLRSVEDALPQIVADLVDGELVEYYGPSYNNAPEVTLYSEDQVQNDPWRGKLIMFTDSQGMKVDITETLKRNREDKMAPTISNRTSLLCKAAYLQVYNAAIKEASEDVTPPVLILEKPVRDYFSLAYINTSMSSAGMVGIIRGTWLGIGFWWWIIISLGFTVALIVAVAIINGQL